MNDAQWYFGRDGAQGGPVSEQEVRRMLAAGELRGTDLVWRDGLVEWQPAARVAEFAAAPRPAVAPPPLPPTAAGLASPGQSPGYPPVAAYATPYQPGQSQDPAQNASMRMLVPIGRSGWAIASGYLGLLAVFPFIGVLFGIGALVTGIFAVNDIKRHPDRHGMGRAIFGIIMGILFALVWVVAFIAYIAAKK
jgi:hypothetical protein